MGEIRGLKVKKIWRGKLYPLSCPIPTSSLSKMIAMEELNAGDKKISSPIYQTPPDEWSYTWVSIQTLDLPPSLSSKIRVKGGGHDWCLYGQRDNELLQKITHPGGQHSSTNTPSISYPKWQGL